MTEDGRPPTVPDADVLACFRAASDPVLTTAEVAAELPIGQRATYERLQALVEAGTLASKTAGRSRVWWLPGATATDARWPSAEGGEKTG